MEMHRSLDHPHLPLALTNLNISLGVPTSSGKKVTNKFAIIIECMSW